VSKVLKPQKVAVDIDGPLIRLTIGDLEVRMEYETALKVSQWLRVRGKQAKRLAGDASRHWSSVGVLDGLTGDPKDLEKLLPRAASFDVDVK